MNHYRIIAGLLLWLLGAAGGAAQQVLSHVAATEPVTADSGAFTNWVKTLELPGFDAALGSLTQVKLSYSGEAYQAVRGENLTQTPGSYSYAMSTSLSVSHSGGMPLFAPVPIDWSGGGSLGSFDGTADFGGASGFSFDQTIGRTAELIYTDPSEIAAFVGLGVISFTTVAEATSSITSPGQFIGQAISKASASLAIEYTYTPIPEPSLASAFLGTAALAAATGLRKRQLRCLAPRRVSLP